MSYSKNIESIIEAISIKYNNLVYEMQSDGRDIIVLSLGEAYFDLPILEFESLSHPQVFHYSHSRGLISLREKISSYYRESYGVFTNPKNEIIITSGSKIGIYYALITVLNYGDEVLIVEPYWVSYTEQVKLIGATPRFIPLGENVYNYDKYITKKTKCIIINNPQNPTGKNLNMHEVQYLQQLAKKHSIWLIADEAYSDFMLDEKFVSFGIADKLLENTIIVNSLSKNFGISGWRIGYLLSNQEIVYRVLKLNQHIMTCAPTPLLMFLDKNFHDIIKKTKPQIKNLLQKRNRVLQLINKLGLCVESGTSTFYFFISIIGSKLNSVEFCDRLLNDFSVAAVPGIGYGMSCDNHIRISIGSESDDRIAVALERIKILIDISG